MSVHKMKILFYLLILDLLIWACTETEAGDVSEWLESIVSSKTVSTNNLVSSHRRSKRSLFNFQNVIICVQPWAQVLSTYGDYGCFCGYKGNGRPLDDTDKCCYDHDICYEKADTKSKTFSESAMGSYFSDYEYSCNDHRIVCDSATNSVYQQALCECDREAAECFAKSRRSYTPKLYDIDTAKYCVRGANFNDLHLESHSLYKLYSCPLNIDQDKCCVDKGYNSAYSLCCAGKIRSKPGTDSSIVACCDEKIYDTRIRMCCYGVLHPNAQHLRCCGYQGQTIDMRFQECVDGKPTLKNATSKSNTTILN